VGTFAVTAIRILTAAVARSVRAGWEVAVKITTDLAEGLWFLQTIGYHGAHLGQGLTGRIIAGALQQLQLLLGHNLRLRQKPHHRIFGRLGH
jgi:hypothetical protein